MKRGFTFLLAFLCVLCAFGSFAAQPGAQEDAAPLIAVESLRIAGIVPQENGAWTTQRNVKAAPVGEVEQFCVGLLAQENAPAGEKAVVTLTAPNYDFTGCIPLLLIPVEDRYYVGEIASFEAGKGVLNADVTVGYLNINSTAPVYLYAEATKLKSGGELTAAVTRMRASSFEFGQSIRVGKYTISKQGGAANPVQIAVGMSGMSEGDAAYIISDESGEILRVVVGGGEVLGIAKKEGELVMSLEYDFSKKAYVSALTRRKLLSKDKVVQVFSDLGFSFMSPPDEQAWLDSQTLYTSSETLSLH